MKLNWQISAGEFFELMRPAALAVSALLSVWVLASARRWRLHLAAAWAWTLGTFFFPLIVLPIYLIARHSRKRRLSKSQDAEAGVVVSPSSVRLRTLVPVAYGIVLLTLIGIYFYRDYRSVDAHLARASQAKVMNQRERAIREYRAALALEDNPHTHKLLGAELAERSRWEDALREFRAAETGHEPDELLPYRIAQALQGSARSDEARVEYEKFLSSAACTQAPADNHCAIAREQIGRPASTPETPR